MVKERAGGFIPPGQARRLALALHRHPPLFAMADQNRLAKQDFAMAVGERRKRRRALKSPAAI